MYWISVYHALQHPMQRASLSVSEMLPLVLFNQTVVECASLWLLEWTDPDMMLAPFLPNDFGWRTLLLAVPQYFALLFLLNVAFAIAHYTFHRIRFLYHHIHSVHHRLKIPHPIGAIFAHPVEHLLANLLPPALALLVVRPPFFVVAFFVAHVSYIVVQSHTPYFPNSAQSSAASTSSLQPSRHNLHHSKVTCNYDNNPYLFDRVMGTFREFKK